MSDLDTTILGEVKFYRKDSCVQHQTSSGTRKESENVAPADPHQRETYATIVEVASS